MPELVMQEPDDGVGQTLLVIHLEMGADKVWGFQDLRTAVHSVRTGWAAGTAEPLPLCPHAPALPGRSHFNSLANCVCLTTVRQTCEFSTFHRGDAEAVGPEPLAVLPDSNPRVMWPWARWSSLLISWTGGRGAPQGHRGQAAVPPAATPRSGQENGPTVSGPRTPGGHAPPTRVRQDPWVGLSRPKAQRALTPPPRPPQGLLRVPLQPAVFLGQV